jgi:hypothetical protein
MPRSSRYRIDWERCYPEEIRARREREERELLADRISDLVVEKLRRSA